MSEPDLIADDPTRPGCEAGQAALHRLLDGEPAWDTPEAAAHRAACVDCREELALARSFAALPAAVVVPAELGGKVLQAAVTASRRRRLYRSAGVGMALAASVLVAVFLAQPTPQTVSESRMVARVPEPKNTGAAQKPLGESVSEARDAIVALTKRAADETRETSATLLPNPRLVSTPDMGGGLEPLTDAQAGAARSVEPIRTSARRALNLFLRAADPPNKQAAQ
jgi:hypothetical protein